MSWAATALAASSQVSIPAQSGSPGAGLIAPVLFDPQNSPVSAIQFDLQYDGSAISVGATLGDAGRNSGKTLHVVDLAPGKQRFLVFGLNQTTIAAGVLINLFVNTDPHAPAGAYVLKLSNVCASDPSGQTTLVTAGDGTVTLNASASQSLPVQPNGVLNAGSLLPGPVAPGEIVTFMGSGIGPASAQWADSPSTASLAGTSVLFDGSPAPLLYAAPNQINAVAPYRLSSKSITQLRITNHGRQIAGFSVAVAAAAPAIFTLDSTGIGSGAILNQDSTVNSPSNPAEKGSVIAVFATGAGQMDPPGADGQIVAGVLPKPLLPVSVRIGGLGATVLYAGAAPGLIAGALQVNAAIPAGAPSGPAVPVALTVGQVRSQAGVTLAIK